MSASRTDQWTSTETMLDPKHIASSLLGGVDWQSAVSGYCRCPGEAQHTHRTAKKDCRVNVDGAPTIHCFHASCAPIVAEANKRLRRELGTPWRLMLPDGQVLRSGDVVQASGMILRREVVVARSRAEGRDPGEQLVLETILAMAARFRPELFETFHWPFAPTKAGGSRVPMRVSPHGRQTRRATPQLRCE